MSPQPPAAPPRFRASSTVELPALLAAATRDTAQEPVALWAAADRLRTVLEELAGPAALERPEARDALAVLEGLKHRAPRPSAAAQRREAIEAVRDDPAALLRLLQHGQPRPSADAWPLDVCRYGRAFDAALIDGLLGVPSLNGFSGTSYDVWLPLLTRNPAWTPDHLALVTRRLEARVTDPTAPENVRNDAINAAGALAASGHLPDPSPLTAHLRAMLADQGLAYRWRRAAACVVMHLPATAEAELVQAAAFINGRSQDDYRPLLTHPNASPAVWMAMALESPGRVGPMLLRHAPAMRSPAIVELLLTAPAFKAHLAEGDILARATLAADGDHFAPLYDRLMAASAEAACDLVPKLKAKQLAALPRQALLPALQSTKEEVRKAAARVLHRAQG